MSGYLGPYCSDNDEMHDDDDGDERPGRGAGAALAAVELARLVRRTREAQRRYFLERTAGALEESKRLERELDRMAGAILDPPPPSLFGEEF